MKYLLLVGILFYGYFAHALAHRQGAWSSLKLGARYSSVLQRRGVVLYGDFQIDPIISAYFLDDKLEFFGDALSYRDFLFTSESIRYRVMASSLSDNPLFPSNSAIKSNYVDRENTYEVSAGLEFFLASYDKDYWGEFDISYAKDIKAHNGYYLSAQSKIKISEMELFHKKVEPHAVVRIGLGDEKHNRYLYGPTANGDGLNNWAYGFVFEFPEDADRLIPVIQLMRFETLGEERRNAAFAKDHNEGFLLSFLGTINFLN